MTNINPFLDETGKIKQFPGKMTAKRAVLAYLAEKFSCDKDYTEQEVNEVIEKWHTFEDYFLLRRELIDGGYLCRTRDGSRYWKEISNEETVVS